VAVSARDGDGALFDCESVDVETCCKVYSRGHGTKFMNAHKIIFQRNWRRVFRVEFPSYGAVLDVQGLCVVSNYNVWLCWHLVRAFKWNLS